MLLPRIWGHMTPWGPPPPPPVSSEMCATDLGAMHGIRQTLYHGASGGMGGMRRGWITDWVTGWVTAFASMILAVGNWLGSRG